MANKRPQKSGREILNTLHELSLDTEEEILAMPPEEVQARLETEGIDTRVLQSRSRKLVAQARLSMAGEQRRAALNELQRLPDQYANSSPEKLRAEISQRLQRTPSDASYVGALFNRFKDAKDEDLQGLLEDLLLLDQNESEPGYGNS